MQTGGIHTILYNQIHINYGDASYDQRRRDVAFGFSFNRDAKKNMLHAKANVQHSKI